MNSKSKKSAPVSSVSSPIVSSEKSVFLKDVRDYLSRSSLKGNPLLKANAEINEKGERLYSNNRENGTTAILLALLSASGSKGKIAYKSDYEAGRKALTSENFKNSFWIRLEKLYKGIPGNRSASPALKLGPVVSGLNRELSSGSINGFDISAIGSESLRKEFGFNF